ncbi:ricin-type beta-trefoil lectin domain-containing protein [Favolaschia claudopus]|uniref:Ricin-type beta-trefoil lectin domain-containing protein n=1 Tax=Favolaschia claudopus TaxID=2862362 RepID=A0AAV9Z3H1_9AGAR
MPIFNGTCTHSLLSTTHRWSLTTLTTPPPDTITSFQSHTRLDLAGGNSADETKVVAWEPHPSSNPDYLNQVWTIQPIPERQGFDAYTIVNKRSGTYLELVGGNGTDGFGVTCSKKASGDDQVGATYQEWEFVKIKEGYYKVRNVASQNYLDIDSGSSDNGTKIQGWWGQLDGNENQLWAFEKAGDNA